jgi:hypothetical protein
MNNQKQRFIDMIGQILKGIDRGVLQTAIHQTSP